MNLAPVKAFITARLGLRFEGGAGAYLAEALKQRMARVGAVSAAAYLERLQTDDAELRELAEVLTIGETYFYREPQYLRLLTETLAPELLARRKGKVRILSVGCATGEEPYSIVIALYERYGPVTEHLFEITAVDIDRRALEKARAGLYGAFAFRALPVELRERYFTAAGDQRRQIAEVIRRQVRLRPFNALTETGAEDLVDQDVVFFRNVSLYFDVAARQTMQHRLQTLLKPGGHLIMGTTETLANNFALMDLHQRNGVFLFTNRPAHRRGDKSQLPAASPAEKVAPMPMPLPTPPRVLAPSTRPLLDVAAAEADYQAALALTRAERFEEALRRLDSHYAAGNPLAHHLTLRAHLLFEQGDAVGAAAATVRALALDPGSADALLLQGRVARFRGETKYAIDSLRQAIYHRPDCWPAHYHLAELYRESGETELARREYRIVLRQLQDDAAARTAGSWPLAVAVKDLRFLCETRLSRLDAAVG